MKTLLLTLSLLLSATSFAANLNLGGGESAIIQANVATQVTCGRGGSSRPGAGDQQCFQENANLRVQVNQLQNDLYNCRRNSETPKVWNCSYVCGGNNGMGSNVSKAVACQEAKDNSRVMCASQCQCEQE